MRSSGSKRSWRLAVVMLLVLAALAFAAPAALAQDEGYITGTVTGYTMGPLGGIEVTAYSLDTPGLSVTGYTANNGVYTLEVPSGTPPWIGQRYQVEASPAGDLYSHHHAWIPAWYSAAAPNGAGTFPSACLWDPASTARQEVQVQPNLTYAGIDIQLPWRDGFMGTVTDTSSNPISGVEVYVYNPASGDYDSPQDLLDHVWAGTADPVAVGNGAGAYAANFFLPTTYSPTYYRILFHDPSGVHADTWYNGESWWTGGDDRTFAYGLGGPIATINQQMSDTGSLGGEVTADNGYGHWDDQAGVTVRLYSAVTGAFYRETMTYGDGEYVFSNVAPGNYKVEFVTDFENPHGNKAYYDEWFNNEPTFADADVVWVNANSHTHGVNAWLDCIPEVWWLHPPFGTNDGPDRYDTAVTFRAWGTGDIADISIMQEASPWREVYANPWWTDGGDGEAHFNLASPKAPAGTYSLVWYWTDPFDGDWVAAHTHSAFQVVESWVPTTPVTPPTPGTTPSTPTPATPTPTTPDPVVTPTPEPTTPAPVAGPVSVSASKASVKRGSLATLRFQVNESVLGGTTDVKITIQSKAGKVVKSINARGVNMNAAASVSFRCKLAKGSYTYTVSASGATASSTLIVR